MEITNNGLLDLASKHHIIRGAIFGYFVSRIPVS